MSNFEDAHLFKDCNKISIMQWLCQNIAVLSHNKNNQDYINFIEQIFIDQLKFKIHGKDPTITRNKTELNYLKNLEHGENLVKTNYIKWDQKYHVPIKNTIDVIITRIYNYRIIRTNHKKSLLKKLTLDSSIKAACSFNNTINDQKYDGNMGFSLGLLWPIL